MHAKDWLQREQAENIHMPSCAEEKPAEMSSPLPRNISAGIAAFGTDTVRVPTKERSSHLAALGIDLVFFMLRYGGPVLPRDQ